MGTRSEWSSRILSGVIGAIAGAAAVLWLHSADENGVAGPPDPEPSQPASEEAGTRPDAGTATKKKNLGRQRVESRSRALELEQLQALGYVDGTYDPQFDQKDVILRTPASAEGYNFYSSRRTNGAQLIDMDGNVVHRWQAKEKGAWQHAELLSNGDVIVVVKDKRLSRYDKDSNLQWTVPGRFHHDVWIHGNEIYALSRVSGVVDYVHPEIPTLVDLIQVLSLDGELKREISILDAIHDSPYSFLLPNIPKSYDKNRETEFDILHTNHVEVFDSWLAHQDPLYAEGNVLISMRTINAIAILDGKTLEVKWIWGPTNLMHQHHPTLLKNGNILLFDNGLKRRGSRVLEIDPRTTHQAWEYGPTPGFFSGSRGSNQRLPNGNTLITESDTGYVFEVTKQGKVVWKFANPTVNSKKEREAIWRMMRVDPKSLTFLN